MRVKAFKISALLILNGPKVRLQAAPVDFKVTSEEIQTTGRFQCLSDFLIYTLYHDGADWIR